MPLNVELKLEVWDSPNSAGIVIDAVRCCKLALNHGVGGQLDGPSSYLMKSPHNQRPDEQARTRHRGVHRQLRRTTRHAARKARGERAPARQSRRRGAKAPAAKAAGAGAAARAPAGAAGGIIVEPMSRLVLDRPRHAVSVGGGGQRGQRARRARRRRALAARPPRAGARAVALAGAGARLAQGAARARASDARSALLEGTDGGTPRVIAVGEVLDFRRARARRRRRRRPSALPIDVARTSRNC